MLRFVGVKIFWSKSNQNSVILIRSSEIASNKNAENGLKINNDMHFFFHFAGWSTLPLHPLDPQFSCQAPDPREVGEVEQHQDQDLRLHPRSGHRLRCRI